MQLEWEQIENKIFDEKIDEITGSHVISQILANRGFDTEEKVKTFLNPMSYPISSPYNFTDMKGAVDRISLAVANQENIVICGDFDCDGVTSTSVLYKTLLKIGAKVGCYIPNRKTESHGLNSKAIIEIISKQKAKLIITVDNGISNISEIRLAHSLGTDIIITDHHEPSEELPEAYAIINPKCSCKIIDTLEFSEVESMVNFAGVMVAYKLSCALLEKYKIENYNKELLPYVMLGTISDVMPLTCENRTIVAQGLDYIKVNMPYWLKKMFELAERNIENIDSETIAFTIAPRINAAGRLEQATTALECLVSDDKGKIDFHALQLQQFNAQRQQMCETSFFEAQTRIQNEINLKTTKAIVLADEKWHIGIVGLLASKIVEKYNRPAFIMTIDKEENLARCSIRGIKGLNVYKVLSELDECFVNYGGHELAGGFSADLNKFSIKELSKRINQVVLRHLEGVSVKKKMLIDAILTPEDLSFDFIEKLSLLEPYGEGNRSCVFGMENLVLKRFDVIGNCGSHLKLIFETQDKKYAYEGLIWNKNTHAIEVFDVADVTFVPKINVFRDKKSIQFMIKNIYIKNREVSVENTDFDDSGKNPAVLVDHRKQPDFFKMLNSYLSNNTAEVYLEDKKIIDELDNYMAIKKSVKNRFNLTESAELIFLSTPCSEEDFSLMVKKTSPQKVHIFNCDVEKTDVKVFIKTMSGMLKYCASHNNGIIEIEKAIAYLATTSEAVDLCINLLNDEGVIKLKSKDACTYSFDFLEVKQLSLMINNSKYMELEEEIDRINLFKEEFLSCDILQIKEMLDV